LEITNRSLLAINASLESAKHRQAKEIRELRRKLRESRLILPPRAYRAVKSSIDHDDTGEEEEEEEGDENGEDSGRQTGDVTFDRVRALLEGLLQTGRRALELKKEDFFQGGKGGTRVLSAEEVRTWRGDNASEITVNGPNDVDTGQDNTDSFRGSTTPHSAQCSDDDFASEEEVAAIAFAPETAPPSPAPPINSIPSP
jgi:hypothetical protein